MGIRQSASIRIVRSTVSSVPPAPEISIPPAEVLWDTTEMESAPPFFPAGTPGNHRVCDLTKKEFNLLRESVTRFYALNPEHFNTVLEPEKRILDFNFRSAAIDREILVRMTLSETAEPVKMDLVYAKNAENAWSYTHLLRSGPKDHRLVFDADGNGGGVLRESASLLLSYIREHRGNIRLG